MHVLGKGKNSASYDKSLSTLSDNFFSQNLLHFGVPPCFRVWDLVIHSLVSKNPVIFKWVALSHVLNKASLPLPNGISTEDSIQLIY